jgi:GDP-mannose 4,6-dehydratase
MKKKVFITGLTGMVGSHLLDYLHINTDWEIHGLIRWRSPLDNIEHHLDEINQKKRIHLHYGDLRDSKSLNDIFKTLKPDYIFHLAAQSFPKTSFSAPIDTYETNILGSSNLLESIKNFSKDSLVHVCSSSEIFGRVSKDKIPIVEDCSQHPASPYAISKIGTDNLARFYFEAYGLKILTTRMFTHTGPRRGDVFAESSFAKQIAMIENDLIPPKIKVGNIESLRTIADVRDAVRAYYLLLTHNPIPGEVYNIGGNHSCKIIDIIEYLIKQSKISISYEVDKDRLRPIDADLQIPNINKFAKHTGWKPEINFEKTMNDLLDYWRNQVKDKKKKFLSR